MNQITQRPWGNFMILADAIDHKVKSIVVKAGQQLSLQSHKQRKEYWTIIKGTGLFTSGFDLEDLETELVSPGHTLEIPSGMLHRIKAGATDLTFIEVQLGTYFGEDDIERFEDDYGRTNG